VNKKREGDGQHVPVLAGPVIEGLKIRPAGCYLDATFGRGGHSRAILDKLGPQGRVIAIDRDPAAAQSLAGPLKADPRLEFVQGEFSNVGRYVAERNLEGQVDGMLLDLGVSSPQLDDAERGFSFQADGPLDMRMDPRHGTSAAAWLDTVDEKTLKGVLKTLGEEPNAARIARAIVAARRERPIERTGRLADVVSAAVPNRGRVRRHPATRTFQAIRIFVNRELAELEAALEAAPGVLAQGGRLCVISFHSLEDRIVKRFMRHESLVKAPYRGLPDVPVDSRPTLKVIGKPIVADEAEVAANPRARSARLRIAERL